MYDYPLDDSVDTIEWRWIEKVTHLDSSLTYQKLLTEINECLDPKMILLLNFDLESMKLLIEQAKQFHIPFIESDDLFAKFISKNGNMDVKQQLYQELGYLEPKKTAKVLDPHLYKRICHVLESNHDILEIQNYRKMLLGEILDDDFFSLELRLSPEKYILDTDYYMDEHSNERSKWDACQLFYLDLVSEYFFDDYYQNVFNDIQQLLKYVQLTNNFDIPSDRLNFYREFASLKEESYEEQQAFFQSHKDLFIMESFYDDIRHLKDLSYQSLVDSCTNFTKDSPLYNSEMSDTYGCDVYYLDGEEFYGFVRSDIRIKKQKFVEGPRIESTEVPTGDAIRRLGHSFTYIGKDDIQTYKDPNQYLTMLYRGIDYRNIGHVYHNDSWSNPDYYYYSDYTNELHTPESLLQESTKYPEILITDLEGIEPCAIVVLDEVTEWDVEFSKKNQLPIVVINTKKYEQKYAPEDYFRDKYER